jgi:hypothetical protein
MSDPSGALRGEGWLLVVSGLVLVVPSLGCVLRFGATPSFNVPGLIFSIGFASPALALGGLLVRSGWRRLTGDTRPPPRKKRATAVVQLLLALPFVGISLKHMLDFKFGSIAVFFAFPSFLLGIILLWLGMRGLSTGGQR